MGLVFYFFGSMSCEIFECNRYIDQSEQELGSGMTALTGKTCAGKSIRLDTLRDPATIRARFNLSSLETVTEATL